MILVHINRDCANPKRGACHQLGAEAKAAGIPHDVDAPAVAHRDVGFAICVKIAYPDLPKKALGADLYRSSAAEGAIACALVEVDLVDCDGKVQLPIVIEIPARNRVGDGRKIDCLALGESAVSLPQHDLQDSLGCAAVGGQGHIQLAVAVKVTDRNIERRDGSATVFGSLESSVPSPQIH